MRQIGSPIDVEVTAISDLATNIRGYELARCDGGVFPDITAGGHVTVHMREDLSRPYSLTVTGSGLVACSIAVKLEPGGGGGSRFMHEEVQVGDRLAIDPPRNDFPLAGGPGPSLFIAGGIGITPIWTMVAACERASRPWSLYYAAKARHEAAFADELERNPAVQVAWSDAGPARFDIPRLVMDAPDGAHLYCCGSPRMLADFLGAARGRPASHIHVESFAPAPVFSQRQALTVELARTGRTLLVPPGKSIADALLQSGVRVKLSCRQGNCGTCEVDVIAGIPEHHDDILTQAERAANKTMMVCCSWAKGDRLVLDI